MILNDERGEETAVNLSQLRQALVSQFSISELRQLAFDLGIEDEELTGSTRSDKALSLTTYLQRRGRLPDLLTRCYQLRPQAIWPEVTGIESFSSPPSDFVHPSRPTRDNFSHYEIGLNKLQARLKETQPHHSGFLVYEQRLIENIMSARRYGDTEVRRSERSEVIDRLNELAQSAFGLSFNKLCG